MPTLQKRRQNSKNQRPARQFAHQNTDSAESRHIIATDRDYLNELHQKEKWKRGYLSESGKQEALRIDYNNEEDNKLMELNDQLEKNLGENLEHATVPFAKAMAYTVGGYTTYEDAKKYIEENLGSEYKDVEDQKAFESGKREKEVRKVGTEQTLIDELKRRYQGKWEKAEYDLGLADNLETARKKVALLKDIRFSFDKDYADDKVMKQLFRKIYHTAKVNEMLLSQMGYFGGSLEFKAELEDDLERWVYLLSTKTRLPRNQMLESMPKSMKPYRTDDRSLLPYHNQFSMSKGHAEFEDVRDIPRKDRDAIEWKLRLVQEDPSKRDKKDRLEMLLAKKKVEPWTLEEVITVLKDDEDKRKSFYTDILELSWSTLDYEHPFENPFRDKDLSRLTGEDIKDTRIGSLKQFARSKTRAHVVGRKANILITPESGSLEFRAKLDRLTDAEVDKIYGRFFSATQGETPKQKAERIKNAVVDNARKSIENWYKTARNAHKPIYAGPSGHTIGYLNMYKKAYDRDEKLKEKKPELSAERQIPTRKKPNLEQARLVMIASLIGKKEHHSYDEVMVASEGISTEYNREAGNELHYQWRENYADMKKSKHTKKVANEAIVRAKNAVIKKYKNKHGYEGLVPKWEKGVY